MKVHKNKKFKALVITKRYVVFLLCMLILVLTSLIASMGNEERDNENREKRTNEIHNAIISSHLNNDDISQKFLKNLVYELIGFNPRKPETFLKNYSKKYKVLKNNDKSIVTYPKIEKNENEEIISSPQKIEEISVKKGLTLTNSTKYQIDITELSKEKLKFKIGNKDPEVLIIHTHTTESYSDSEGKYEAKSTDRSTDEEKNMIAVGEKLKNILNENGIKTIHDHTVHDYPSYNGAYNRSRLTVEENLKKYPSIKIVLDLHRDGIVREDGTKVKVVSDINGKKTAQCMFVVGTDTELKHDNWRENLKLASKIQANANKMYPGLMRPINLRDERFNQEITMGSLIIEVGSNGNTMEEAISGIECMGYAIVKTLEECK